MSTTELGSHEWWEEYMETVNQDEEMDVRGHTYFDENFLIQMGDDRFLVEMHEGNVEDVVADPGVNEDWSFSVKGDRQAWEEFVQEYPPAHNNEIIASDYRTNVKEEDGHLDLQGSNKKIFQNLRPFQRAVELMRVAHNS